MARYEFLLPDIGEGLTEAEIVRWLVRVGEPVTPDQPVVELQTDKAVIDIPSPHAGTMAEHRGAEGDLLRVGSVLFVLEIADSSIQSGSIPAAPAAPVAPAPAAPAPAAVRAAPAVRRAARAAGIDLSRVQGTGTGGRILLSDIQQAVAPAISPPTAPSPPPAALIPPPTAPSPPPAAVERIPLRGVRRVIAQRMEQTLGVPMFTALDEADVTELVLWRQRLQSLTDRRLTFMPFILKAVVLALQENPQLNGHYDAATAEFIRMGYYHIGVGTAAEQGLVVPVLRDIKDQSILELAEVMAAKAEAARQNRLGREELTGSTFTISNFGALGGQSGTPILNPPEVAILGVGRTDRLPRFVGDEVAARHIMHLALTVDHRVVDGHHATGFLKSLKSYLEEPGWFTLRLH